LDRLIGSGTESFRGAVCFFTRAGFLLLRRHATVLNRPDSFFVASVDYPTNLEALKELHGIAPGHTYIHLGGATPEEIRVSRALMHSKILLAANSEQQRLWVGSHNFTGQAIEGGNIEAGIELTGDRNSQPIRDASAHLEVCRATAELFDPAQMERYKQIQNERLPLPSWIRPDRLLILHAEARNQPSSAPFTCHLQIVPTDFDKYFLNDRGVRLYLHSAGTLRRGIPASFANVTLWSGSITGVVRTHRHPRNSGVQGQFQNADYEIELPDVFNAPVFDVKGTGIPATSQIVLRMDARREPGREVYSIDKVPVTNVYDADAVGQDLHEVDDDMRELFTPESFDGQRMLYRPVRGMKQQLKVEGYEETMRTMSPALPSGTKELFSPEIMYVAKEAKRPADAFLFVSKHVIDREQQPES